MKYLREIYEKIKIPGKVRNYSSKTLLVIETDSPSPTAHKLSPGMKSPPEVDCDGIKRFDGKPISGHPHWWKIVDFTIARVYDFRSGIKVDTPLKSAVPVKEFGEYKLDKTGAWGEPIAEVTEVKRDQSGAISKYFIEQYGWISKAKAVELAAYGKIDNATPVFPKNGNPYIRSRPDANKKNDLGSMIG